MKRNTIFITQKGDGAHFKFTSYEMADELFVSINNDALFFEEYLKYLTPTETPNGGTKFDACGINYYTKEQAQIMYDRIQNDTPKEYTILLAWLEKIISSPLEGGFYILGV